MDRREKDEFMIRKHWGQNVVFTDAWNTSRYDHLEQEQGTEFRELCV